MSLSEASIFFFSCLCRWQKRLFSFFHAYVVDRSDYFLHFALMLLTEAIIFSILRLCRWQKRFFSSFRAYVVDRSIGKTLFCLTEWCCSLKFLVLFPSNRKFRFQILFLKSTDRVEVGCDDVSIGMMIENKKPIHKSMNGLFYIDKNDLFRCSFRGSFWTSCHFRMDMGR